METAFRTTPTLSVIIPVLREGGLINGLLRHVRGLAGGDRVELIVVDGDPCGGTVGAITERGVVTALSEPGRAAQMNAGARLAAGGALLFLHADTLLPPDAIALIDEALRDGGCVAGAFDLGFATKRRIFKITECYVRLRTRLTRVPFGDQAQFVRKDYFEALGGYRCIPIMEDVDLMTRIRKRGDRIRIIPRKVLTSPRRYEQEGLLFATFRNLLLQALYRLGVAPERLAAWYRS